MKKRKAISEEERLNKKILKVARREMNKASHGDYIFIENPTGKQTSYRIARNGELLPNIKKLFNEKSNTQQTEGDS